MKHHRKHTTIFVRIMTGLILPLLFLTVIFIAIQLTNQMNVMNEFYKIESRLAFEAIHETFSADFRNSVPVPDAVALHAKAEQLKSSYHIENLDIYNFSKKADLFSGEPITLTPADHQAIEASLYQIRNGHRYAVRINKETQQLTAFIPFQDQNHEIYVIRATFLLANLMDAFAASRRTLLLIVLTIIGTGIVIGRSFAKSIVNPLKTLNEATQEIMKGNLGKHVSIHTGDEIETLGNTFNHMSEALREMKRRAEDANPLTQLPGNQGILHELKKRIYERQKFVVFHADLDRFKTFNDHYGLARGDEAIRKTADMLRDAVREKGAKDDFVGHQGGDDFMFITRPNHAKELAEHILQQFDTKIVRSLYSKEDYEKGYTLELDRRRLSETGEERLYQFPLLSISLAGISNVKRDFADYFDCMNAIVEVKKEVKKIVTSAYQIRE